MEKAMATHSSVLAWRIPGTVEPGGLPSVGSRRVGHNWRLSSSSISGQGFPGGASGREPCCQSRTHKRCRFDPWDVKISWRRAWQPTPVFLSGDPQGQRDWQTTVHRAAKNQAWVKHACMIRPECKHSMCMACLTLCLTRELVRKSWGVTVELL